MKSIQRKILNLAQTRNLGSMTYRAVGNMLGGEHPYQIQYNIKQLIKSGQLVENKRTKSISLALGRKQVNSLINVPVMGSVSCGIAIELANNEEQGFLAVSPSLLGGYSAGKTFALKAAGNSMNRAQIDGNSVEDGDYVIVRQSEWGVAKDGDYVISLIEDCANLKRVYIDKGNSRLILFSESDDPDYVPIILADEDLEYYKILGVAFSVIKATPTPQLFV